jgi:hypothetical protein
MADGDPKRITFIAERRTLTACAAAPPRLDPARTQSGELVTDATK